VLSVRSRSASSMPISDAVIRRLYCCRAKHSEHAFVHAGIEPDLEDRPGHLRGWIGVFGNARAASKIGIVNDNWRQARADRNLEKELLGGPEVRSGRFGRSGSCSRGM
jgi:hypothetical protein